MAKQVIAYLAQNSQTFVAATFLFSLTMAIFEIIYGELSLFASVESWITNFTIIANWQTQSFFVWKININCH